MTASCEDVAVLAAGRDSDVIRRHMSSDSMVSVCSSGGSQQSTAGDAGADRKKKPRVWVISRVVWCTVVVQVKQSISRVSEQANNFRTR